jgi:acetyl-CoA acyltransferase
MTVLTDIVIVDAIRTPIGKFRGALANVRADHLGAHVLNALIARAGVTSDAVDDVIFGCVTQIGEQSANVARTALLSAGWPESIPGMTIDRKCGSSEAAVHVAAGLITAGANRMIVAGGVESMSRVPMGSNRDLHGEAYGWMLTQRHELTSQGIAAERVADKWGMNRAMLDEFALASHSRAAAAVDAGRFEREITVVPVNQLAERGKDNPVAELKTDETVRRGTTAEKLASLKLSFREDGRLTAGNSSQIGDAAAALLLTTAQHAKELGLKPRARLRAMTTIGSDPTLMLTGPIPATARVLKQAGLELSDIDRFEINEAFASVPLAWLEETGADPARLNVNGGAIALGHPLGASGARLMTTLITELERSGLRYGLQAMCCNGGLATATIVERLG